jgi:hypothetical protein
LRRPFRWDSGLYNRRVWEHDQPFKKYLTRVRCFYAGAPREFRRTFSELAKRFREFGPAPHEFKSGRQYFAEPVPEFTKRPPELGLASLELVCSHGQFVSRC